jgi:predicted Zn-dependent protease with MMP-like domain
VIEITDDNFQQLINQALEQLPGEHARNIKNVAILYAEIPTFEQRQELALRHDQTLLGLYEGTPLTKRQGISTLYPDRITLFKQPLLSRANTLEELKEDIRHTLWHEIGHYYGLDHAQIHNLEN